MQKFMIILSFKGMKKELHPFRLEAAVYNDDTERVFRTFIEETVWTRY
jgi:hypothetical protein